MEQATRSFFDKRGEVLVKNLQKRHFEAYYCATKAEALKQVLALMPEGSTIGWGGAILIGVAAAPIGLLGDLAESAIKRAANAKDSGSLPGIGGILDVLDSLLPMGPLFYAYLRLAAA